MSEKAESHPLVKDSLSIYLLNIILSMIDFSLFRKLFQQNLTIKMKNNSWISRLAMNILLRPTLQINKDK